MSSTEIGNCKGELGCYCECSNKNHGYGIVIRNLKGEIMACFCLSEPFYSKPIVVKLIALRRAMVFCLELGFTVAQFEGDA